MSINLSENKPIIGFSCGDLNGIGTEIILKALSDNRFLEFCVPVVFASNKLINFYRKGIAGLNFNFTSAKELSRLNSKQVNVLNCWEEEVAINPGSLSSTAGQYAVKSLQAAAAALKGGQIHGLVTAPIHKKNIQSEAFSYTGHTPYLKDFFGVQDVLMLMVSENMRVGLVTEHVPLKEVASQLSKEKIVSKLHILHASLKKDFNIEKPKIAVLALNPHAGDDTLIGTEEEEIIKPAIKEAKQRNMLVVGPFSADAFFARGQYNKFDAVLAMYHDQGLIPFKSLSYGEGINFTAGLPGIRTSPDHGTAFDIAGKDKADSSSFKAAIFSCIDILNNQRIFDENHRNPIKKISASIVAGAVDEKIIE
ncbi:MAG TPA: 4-hydroxythreonine-4-phosphate dehydrogenase PdxA [Chitinophagaceae bacterium]|nr:4-hydroxythreonine-4-phosphate dehydrogenase PdxA [Chitinophagaceae bacterium]